MLSVSHNSRRFRCCRYDADCEGFINYPLFREAMVRGHTPNRRFQKTGLSTAFSDDEGAEEEEDEDADKEEVCARYPPISMSSWIALFARNMIYTIA